MICPGADQAEMINLLLLHWGLVDSIKFLCADTTASNTGIHKGTWALLEAILGRDLFFFACRHHMLECIISAIFDSLFDPSTGPNIQLFDKFKRCWPEIKKNEFESASTDDTIWYLLEPIKKKKTKFIMEQLQQNHAREDYVEFLQLALLFIGKPEDIKIKIRRPGAVHRARWMAKIIYCLKIYIFRKFFDLTEDQLCALRIINVFVIHIYIEYWFTCELPTYASRNDLKLLQDIQAYSKVNPDVSRVALRTFSGHTWYLNEVTVGLAFFDSRISSKDKAMMVRALKNKSALTKHSRIDLSSRSMEKWKIHHLVTEETMKFFSALDIEVNFLKKDPSSWKRDSSYQAALGKVKNLKVTNDIAERAVKLAEMYNGKITRTEDQFQNLLQSVTQNMETFSKCNKKDIAQALKG